MTKKFTFGSAARFALFTVLAAAPLVAGAIPAKPGLHTVSTPDGKILRVEKRGGPFSHAIFSEDGILLSQLADGNFVYATLDENGLPSPTTLLAHAPEYRSTEELRFIDNYNHNLMINALQVRDQNVKAKMMPPARVIPEGRAENPGLCKNTMPVNTGSPKCLVILIEFLDEKFHTPNAHEYYNDAINKPGFDSGKWIGSVSDYFKENSMGKYTPQFDVYGPVTLTKNMSYYGGNDRNGNDSNPSQMVTDACAILDETTDINFADYDNDGDGNVDNVFVYFAGYGEANSVGRPNTVWPHSADVSMLDPRKKYIFDNVRIDHYACTNEIFESKHAPEGYEVEGIGTFIHEFSHVLGLPDLYETSYRTGSFTPGYWSCLDYGPYNNDGHTPPNYGAYERYALGWMTPEELLNTGEHTLQPVFDTNTAYMINTTRPNEYFLLENRRLEGWDQFIPNEGMLVWHIDFSPTIFEQNIVNNTPNHQYVDIIEADDTRDPDSRDGDIFPGTKNVTELGFNTTPKLISWNNKDLMRELSEIRIEGKDVKFMLKNTDPNSSGIEQTVATAGSLRYGRGQLSNDYAESVSVYDTVGRNVANVGAGASVILPGGIYIVATPEGAQKIQL